MLVDKLLTIFYKIKNIVLPVIQIPLSPEFSDSSHTANGRRVLFSVGRVEVTNKFNLKSYYLRQIRTELKGNSRKCRFSKCGKLCFSGFPGKNLSVLEAQVQLSGFERRYCQGGADLNSSGQFAGNIVVLRMILIFLMSIHA